MDKFIFLAFIFILIKAQTINETAKEDIYENKEYLNLLQEFANEWESKLVDYKMEYMYSIPVAKRDQEIFYENVTTVPSNFKGSFFITDESLDKIEFQVKDPNQKIIYKAVGHFNVFDIPINKTGRYTLIFRNNASPQKLVISFNMNSGQNNMLNSKDLSNTEKKMETLESMINKFNTEFKLSREIQAKRYKSKF